MREHQVGQDRSVKSTVCGRMEVSVDLGKHRCSLPLIPKNEKTRDWNLTSSPCAIWRNHAALARGKPQEGAKAARKACLLKNPAARCKKAANLPALVAASPRPPARARARRGYDRAADIPDAALRCCAPRREHWQGTGGSVAQPRPCGPRS